CEFSTGDKISGGVVGVAHVIFTTLAQSLAWSLTSTVADSSNAMDTSPTSLFNSYEQEFQQIISSIKDKLEGDAKEQQGVGKSTIHVLHQENKVSLMLLAHLRII